VWTDAWGVAYNLSLLAFELLGPLPFVALCWGRISWPVMRLLWSQVQFKVVCALVAWSIAACTWGLIRAVPGKATYWAALSAFIFSPLVSPPPPFFSLVGSCRGPFTREKKHSPPSLSGPS
jgi:hypothetical protein